MTLEENQNGPVTVWENERFMDSSGSAIRVARGWTPLKNG